MLALEAVTCLCLHRSTFNELLTEFKMHSFYAAVSHPEHRHRVSNIFSTKRRVSSVNIHGQRDEGRSNTLYRRMAKFITESAWDSLYGRLYRECLLSHQKTEEFGPKMVKLMGRISSLHRSTAVMSIREEIMHIEEDIQRRTADDGLLLFGLLSQRNALRDKLCEDWPKYLFLNLCKAIKIIHIAPFEKVL